MKNSLFMVLTGVLVCSPVVAHADIVADSGRPINFKGCYPYQTLYFSYNEEHTKAVELCQISNEDGYSYRYTFGRIDKPELQVIKDSTEVGWYTTNGLMGFAMHNKGYFYHLETTRHPRKGRFVSLVVTKGRLHGKLVADIPLGNDYYGFQYGLGEGVLSPFTWK